MLTLALTAIVGAFVVAVTWWWNRRWNQLGTGKVSDRRCPGLVDVGPPIFDVCDWLDGRRNQPSRI